MHLLLTIGRILFGHSFIFEKLMWAAFTIAIWEGCKKIYWPAMFQLVKYAAGIIADKLYNQICRLMEIGEVVDFQK